MKLVEALEALNESPRPESPVLEIHLACGFTPLHFLTFLNAHLRREFPEHKIAVEAGLFGDLPGNLERLERAQGSAVVAIIEWQDLDPRLGIRQLGGWAPRQLGDITQNVRGQAARLSDSLESIARRNNVTLALPTLPLPPVAFTPGWLLSPFESELRELVAGLASRLGRSPGVRLVSSQRLDRGSPCSSRFDVKSELSTGFPYSLSHADNLAALIAHIIRNPIAKKGLITDLDDTFWMGVLGEVNVEGIFWDLDHRAQKHGLYQQMLASLSAAGILLAVASKNDPGLVEEAFRRANPILPRDRIFPLEVNWGPKSASVSRILQTWNISADSVVFIDDSFLDLAEVKNAHPDMECLRFPLDDDKAAYQLLEDLRDMFGKSSLSAEDEIRLDSIRASHTFIEATRTHEYTPECFLREAEGKLTVSFLKHPPDPRALELINKTNQFNLNGKRHTELSWKQYLNEANVFLLVASYEDKFGPLGKIAVVAGRSENYKLSLDHWVMSCRAFSRRIEHACLLHLFQKFDAKEAAFDFLVTPRNGPLRDFFADIVGSVPQTSFSMTRQQLLDNCPPIFLRFQEPSDE
jgi:FkbH-like protein